MSNTKMRCDSLVKKKRHLRKRSWSSSSNSSSLSDGDNLKTNSTSCDSGSRSRYSSRSRSYSSLVSDSRSRSNSSSRWSSSGPKSSLTPSSNLSNISGSSRQAETKRSKSKYNSYNKNSKELRVNDDDRVKQTNRKTFKNSRSSSPKWSRHERSPTPNECQICVDNLTMRITKDHLYEIFSVYGKIKEIDLHIDRFNKSNKRFSFIVYSTPKEAENAMLFMNRGQIDGHEVVCTPVWLSCFADQRRRYYNDRYWRRSPLRFKHRLPTSVKRRSPRPHRLRTPRRNNY